MFGDFAGFSRLWWCGISGGFGGISIRYAFGGTPRIENLGGGNLGGWKPWWLKTLVVENHLVDFQNSEF